MVNVVAGGKVKATFTVTNTTSSVISFYACLYITIEHQTIASGVYPAKPSPKMSLNPGASVVVSVTSGAIPEMWSSFKLDVWVKTAKDYTVDGNGHPTISSANSVGLTLSTASVKVS